MTQSIVPMKFLKGQTPQDYACWECKITRVKLWRQRAAMELYCVKHAAQHAKIGVKKIDRKGISRHPETGVKTNWIGELPPAIPELVTTGGEVERYYRPQGLPRNGLKWWTRLPLT